MQPTFDGVLFFPVTPFTETGDVDLDAAGRATSPRASRPDPAASSSPAAQANSTRWRSDEFGDVVRTAVEVVAGRVPVYAGAGGSVAQAKRFAQCRQGSGRRRPAAAAARTSSRSRRPVWSTSSRAVAAATDLPVIVYNRNNARFTEASADRGRQDPQRHRIQGRHRRFRPGRAHRRARSPTSVDPDFLFFNGLPTAETTQLAYRAIGVPLYSSATFAFAPDLALAFYNALESGNDELINALLERVLPSRWCACATPCPATPSRSSRPA